MGEVAVTVAGFHNMVAKKVFDQAARSADAALLQFPAADHLPLSVLRGFAAVAGMHPALVKQIAGGGSPPAPVAKWELSIQDASDLSAFLNAAYDHDAAGVGFLKIDPRNGSVVAVFRLRLVVTYDNVFARATIMPHASGVVMVCTGYAETVALEKGGEFRWATEVSEDSKDSVKYEIARLCGELRLRKKVH